MEYDEGYSQWKSWNNAFQFDETDAAYFAGEFADRPLSGARLLEVGFGEGRFLSWAARQGAHCKGCELIQALVDRGQALGLDVRHGMVQDCFGPNSEQFDVIVAFDVFEHIPNGQVVPTLLHLKSLLAPGGRILLRTPNGESPFGRVTQYGDPTHVSVHSMGRYRQMAAETGMRLLRCDNPFRVVCATGGWWGQRDKIRYRLRDVFEWAIGFAYDFRGRPMDPNIIAVYE